ncbi:MAG: hypothetical protein H6738_19465 [Alphaproteobacteria bacterium]|nr:hypothetical protein [Alphaproteobacteria bacterium]MCB9698969.1 hypothetical protein [Alphaproteobacteria bacterium]
MAELPTERKLPDARGPLPRLPLRAWLVLSHASVLVLPLLVLLGSGAFNEDLRNQTRWDLEHQGALMSVHAAALLRTARQDDPAADMAAVGTQLSSDLAVAKSQTLSGIRVTDADGTVVATSGDTLGEELRGTPEVDAALAGHMAHELRPRPAPSLRQPLSSESRRAGVRVFVAVPVALDGEVVGAVVLSRTPREELQALYHMAPGVLAATAAAALSAVVLGVVAAWVATRSMRLLEDGAQRIAEADFGGLDDLQHPRRSHLSEVARTADAVATMAERLRDRLAYIGEFASHVSHEFKTPIATLKGTLELIADDEDMPREQLARFLDNGSKEVDRMERLVSGLLALARADEDRDATAVDLDAVVRRTCERLGVTVEGRADGVRGDPAQLESVLSNLVENARHHGGEGVAVRVRCWSAPGRTGFEVEDDGKGISEANLPRVFERFFTTDRGGRGTGLGLALVRTIARRHGGEVTVRSEPGRTCFRVDLPRA